MLFFQICIIIILTKHFLLLQQVQLNNSTYFFSYNNDFPYHIFLFLYDSNGIRTHNHLVRKRTLNHLAKLAKWLSCCEYLSVRCIWLYVIIMSHTSFRVNLLSKICLNFKELLALNRHHIWSLSDSNKIRIHNHLVHKRTLGHLAKLAKWLSCCEYLSVWCIWLHVIILSLKSFRVNPRSIVFLNVKELLAWSRPRIWSLSDSNGIWTHNHLVRKLIVNHLTKLATWLSCIGNTYMYGAYDWMLLSCHVRISERIYSYNLFSYFFHLLDDFHNTFANFFVFSLEWLGNNFLLLLLYW